MKRSNAKAMQAIQSQKALHEVEKLIWRKKTLEAKLLLQN